MDSKKPIISLSTSYLQSKFKGDGYAMLVEAAEMGFEYVELGHSTTIQTIEGILKALGEGVVKVSSLHNFCPIPPFTTGAAPNLFSPSTPYKIESNQWLRHTKNTLEFAKECNAKAVVCHSGELGFFFARPDRHIARIIEEDGYEKLAENEDYLKEVENFKKKSAKKSEKKDYKNILKNISNIQESTKEAGVFLGLENRDGFAELPLDWNIEKFFEVFKDVENVKFWHDVGHSMRKQLALLDNQLEFAQRTKNLVAGWHLHDCSTDAKDHLAIGKGCIDFKALSTFFDKENHIFTLELNRAVERNDAIDSIKRIQDLF